MHELAVCQELLHQVEMVVAENGATAADHIAISVGPLSGVEPALLASAFTIAREGTAASNAELEIETASIMVECRQCGRSSTAQSNRLICGDCGDWRVRVTRGEELMLLRVGLASETGLPAQ
jgi:hydrogenase nickel incorporation protein HypA/HybF